MHRFFLTDKDQINEKTIEIKNKKLIHQISRVLRFKLLDKIQVIKDGKEIEGQILRITKTFVRISILNKEEKQNNEGQFILVQSLLKKNAKFELVLQKGTELGVTKFIPLITERCEYKGRPRIERWEKIVKEAAEQCGRVNIPEIEIPAKLEEVVERHENLQSIIPHPSATQKISDIVPEKNSAIYIGPEGGFTEEETYQINGIKIKMGERILRSETAGIVATALIQAKREEW